MTKKEARKEFLAKRKLLTPGDQFLLNQKLYTQFFSFLNLSFIRVLHLFLSTEEKHEVDTWTILDRLRREYPHIRVVIPKMKDGNQLEHFYFEGMQQLKVNSWGIAEPQTGIPAEVQKIDLVIVPLVVCDRLGNRVGYGKGFYDSFLRDCRSDCQKIGISFFEPVDQIDDVDSWDVKLDLCITPKGILRF